MALRKQRTELLVGLFVFFGLLVMGFLVFQFGRITERLRDHYPLVIQVPDATGIRKGVPVRLGGADVGYVAAPPSLLVDFSGLRLDLKIYEEIQIPRGSRFSVATAGLMGDTFISVSLPEMYTGDFLKPGEEITGTSPVGLDEIPQKADLLISEVSTAVDDIGRGVDLLEKAFGSIDKGLLNESNLADVQIILTQLKISTKNVGDASTQLEPLLKNANLFFDDGRKVVSGMDGTLKELNVALGSFQSALEEAGPAVARLDPTLAELDATLANLNRTINKIENGNGLASALLNDTELRRDLEVFVDKLEKNGILGYPKEGKNGGGLFSRKTAEPEPAPKRKEQEPEKPKGRNPFSWLKPKK